MLKPGTFEAARRIARFHQTLFAELAALPGISALGSLISPPGKPFLKADYWIDRLPTAGEGNASPPQAILSPVAPGTFKVLGIPLLRGRDFDDRDTEKTFAAVINETLARKSFPGQDRLDVCFWRTRRPPTADENRRHRGRCAAVGG